MLRASPSGQRVSRRNPKFEWETEFIKSGLTGNTGFVGLLMSTLDNGDGRGFFVSAKTIESWCGLNERTARTQINKLIDAGWIVRTSKGGRRGGQALASTYELVIPANSNRSNLPSQPERDVAQPDNSARPLDQVSLDPSPLDLSFFSPGDEVSGELVAGLQVEEKLLFVPSFSAGDLWMYAPDRAGVVKSPAEPAPSPSPDLSPREERRQRDHFIRTNRDEGLDQFGEPVPPRHEQARYRSRS
ncbi:hypothetical protein GCM10027425_24770 [Alteromonas gracilis]